MYCFSAAGMTYEITVNTGSRRYAGTNASVYTYIIGTDGRTTEKLELVPRAGNAFGRSSTDVFSVTADDVGQVGPGRTRTGVGY